MLGAVFAYDSFHLIFILPYEEDYWQSKLCIDSHLCRLTHIGHTAGWWQGGMYGCIIQLSHDPSYPNMA